MARETSKATIAETFALALALLLAVASCLKAYALGIHPITAADMIRSRTLAALVIHWELLLATWLLTGRFRTTLWWVVFTTFSVFLAAAGYQLWNGAESCACFGTVKLNPAYSLAMDAFILTCLVVCRPSWCEKRQKTSARLGWWVSFYTIATMASTAWIASYETNGISLDGMIEGENNLVVLSPADWIGHPLPLLGYIRHSTALSHGSWEVLFHRHNCSKCELVLPGFLAQPDKKLAIVEIPTFGSEMSANLGPPGVLELQLSPEYDWITTTPTQLSLTDGQVTAVRTSFKGASAAGP